MRPTRDFEGFSAAFTVWCEMGGDRGLFHSLWPLIRGRIRPPKPSERFTRKGTCVDCEINAGPGWLTEGLNRQGRCEACERWRRRHGPALKVSREDADAPPEGRQTA